MGGALALKPIDLERQWWTRSQRIRTFGEIPFEVALLEAEEQPVYQRIAGDVAKLAKLGMRNAAVARRLGVDPKTVSKSMEWHQGTPHS